MQYAQNGEHLDLIERERIAWANGDTAQAAMLGRCADDADELRRLRKMYWDLRQHFPIHSSARKGELLEKIAAIWDAIKEAGDIADA